MVPEAFTIGMLVLGRGRVRGSMNGRGSKRERGVGRRQILEHMILFFIHKERERQINTEATLFNTSNTSSPNTV